MRKYGCPEKEMLYSDMSVVEDQSEDREEDVLDLKTSRNGPG